MLLLKFNAGSKAQSIGFEKEQASTTSSSKKQSQPDKHIDYFV